MIAVERWRCSVAFTRRVGALIMTWTSLITLIYKNWNCLNESISTSLTFFSYDN